jgi:diadenosine tetraphosphate (Ap4A) HIT family hydrolase
MAAGELTAAGDLAVAFPDAFPVSPGHTLIVPRRHEPDYFALTEAEQAAMWHLVTEVRRVLDARHAPNGYNLGINAGAAAGQTVGHAHLHVIPRYAGDVEDPRGGVRWIVPRQAAYWER